MLREKIDRIHSTWILLSIILLYSALSLGGALSFRPIEDNLQHIGIVSTFLKHGYLGCPSMATGELSVYTHIDRYVYNMPPGIYMLLAVWFKIFGAGLVSLRTFGIFFGALGLLSWTAFLKKIGAPKKIWIPALLFMALDSVYTLYTFYRPFEPVVNTLLPLALLSYLHFRETHLNWALLISNFLTALSVTIHPNGFLVWMEVTAFQIYLDYKNLKMRHLFFYLTPYLILGLPVLLYILQDFETFKTQFLGNMVEEKPKEFWAKLYYGLRSDLYLAYGGVSAKARLLLFVPFVYLVSVATIAQKRQKENYDRIVLFLLSAHALFFLLMTTSARNEYALYFVPLFSISMASALNTFWQKGAVLKWIALCSVSLSLLLSIGARLSAVYKNEYHNLYLPEMTAMKQMIKAGDSVYAPMETALVLGMDNLIADPSFGYFNKEKRNIMIHGKSVRFVRYLPYPDRPEISDYIEERIKESDLVFNGKLYRMYRSRE